MDGSNIKSQSDDLDDVFNRFVEQTEIGGSYTFLESPSSDSTSSSSGKVSHLPPWQLTSLSPWIAFCHDYLNQNRESDELSRRLVEVDAISESLESPARAVIEAARDVAEVGPREQVKNIRRFLESLEKRCNSPGLDTDVGDLARSVSETETALAYKVNRMELSRVPGALCWLAGLESEFDGPVGWLTRSTHDLGRRSRRFETSLANQLGKHGFDICARAALTIGDTSFLSASRDYSSTLCKAKQFAEDKPLRRLTSELLKMRGLCLAYLEGKVPISRLQRWVDYLHKHVDELTESFSVSRREAISFAHYSLHLVNICDLGASDSMPLNEESRTTLLELENRLKELANMHEPSERTPVLREPYSGHYLDTEESDSPKETYIEARLNRLSTAMTSGFGLDSDIENRLDSLDFELAVLAPDAVSEALRKTSFRGLVWFDEWQARYQVGFLSIVFSQLDGPDLKDYSVDLSPVSQWVDRQSRGIRKLAKLTELQARATDEGGNRPSALGIQIEKSVSGDGADNYAVCINLSDELSHVIGLLSYGEVYGTSVRTRLEERGRKLLSPDLETVQKSDKIVSLSS